MLGSHAMRCFYAFCSLLFMITGIAHAQTDLAQGKVVAASTQVQPAANAVDGNAGSRWESAVAVDPAWISVDLTTAYALSSVVIDWEAANASDFQVQGSNDNTNWTTLASRTGLAFGNRTDTITLSGSYRHVRVYGTKRSIGNQWGYSIWSLKVYGNAVASSSSPATSSAASSSVLPGGTNIAQGKTTFASTALQTANNAVDGNSGTRWESNHGVDPSWISVDLGAPATLSSIVIDWEAANAATYQIQGSNDNTNWSTLSTRTGGTFGNRTDSIAISGSYRYVRMYGTTRTSQYGYSIFEFKVYGTITGGTSSTPSSATSSSASSVALGNIVPLFNAATVREPELVTEYADRVETLFSDRGRDRHAKEEAPFNITAGMTEAQMMATLEQGSGYDHYLPHYWEKRTIAVIIKDYVAKGGNRVDFDVYTLTPLGPKDFRVWFLGVNTLAEFYDNGYVGLVPGEINHYRRSLGGGAATSNPKTGQAIKIGDRMEIEISQFLDPVGLTPEGSRSNYYGTTFLYMVGGGKGDQPNGIVPWYGKPTEDKNPDGSPRTCNPARVGLPGERFCPTIYDSFPLPQNAWLGGRLTTPYQYSNEPMGLFKSMGGNISAGNRLTEGGNAQLFMLGRRLVHTEFDTGAHTERPVNLANPGRVNSQGIPLDSNERFTAQANKLGPLFYSKSCVGCHFNNGRSIPKGLNQTINNQGIKVAANATGAPHALYGSSLQPASMTSGSGVGELQTQIVSYAQAPNYADGTANTLTRPVYNFIGGTAPSVFSVRNSPPFIGVGLLEAVPEADILAIEAANNGVGISGRAQRVIEPLTGQTRLGRFGWKAGAATVQHQIALALRDEMGITTSLFQTLDCGSSQTGCTLTQGTEINNTELDQMVKYINLLGVPARRDLTDTQALRGEVVFREAGCNACHKEQLKTSQYAPLAELRGQTIRPYTDLLLHDMGPGLVDNLPEAQASGAEWRTAPLWGIGLTSGVAGYREAYMHDGRAKTLHEAIMWHDGEGANSRKAYVARTQADKDAMIKFLKSL